MFIKYLYSNAAIDRVRDTARVIREYRNLNLLRDHNIVAVYDAAWIRTENGEEYPFVATEHLNGISLQQWRKSLSKAPSLRQCAGIIQIIAATLQRLLNVPDETVRNVLGDARVPDVMHLDLKPDNAMVLRQEDTPIGIIDESNLKIVDFGSAGTAESATSIGTAYGNEYYSAPERFLVPDQRPLPDKSWDIYSLGGILYFLFAGSNPKSADNCTREEWSRYVSELDLGNSDLNKILHKCLAFDSSERFDSPGHLDESITAWLKDEPIPHIGKEYSRIQSEVLLFKRVWNRDDLKDHSYFIAQHFVLLALLSIATSAFNYVGLQLGYASEGLFSWVMGIMNGFVGLIAIEMAVATRVQSSFRRFAWPGVILVGSVLINAYALTPEVFLTPTQDEIDKSLTYNLPLYALLAISLGSTTRAWRHMSVIGVLLLALAPVFRLLRDQPWFHDYTLPFLSGCEVLFCISYALYAYAISQEPRK